MSERIVERGRGAAADPSGRFERLGVVCERVDDADDRPPRQTELFRDSSMSIFAHNDNKDVAMDVSVNPYRSCEQGRIDCHERPYHEYLGLLAGVYFESRIFVKADAPALLRNALMAKSWMPQVMGFTGVTDPYQPVERRLKLTRACIEVLAQFRNPVAVITTSHTVTRDIDLLSELAAHQAVQVMLSVTTLNDHLAGVMEPSASRPGRRFDAIRALSAAGIPVGVMVAPIIPGLTDHEVPAILGAAADAGALTAGRTVVRLPRGVKDLFADWLAVHMPERRDKVLNPLHAASIHQLFDLHCRKLGLTRRIELSTAAFRRPGA